MNQAIRLNVNTNEQSYCPIATCAEVLADRWSVIILRDIAIFDQRTFRSILANNDENISSSVLAGRLQRLCDIGLLHHKGDPAHSQRKIYFLTPPAIDLLPLLIDMAVWALTYASPSEEPIPLEKTHPQSQYSEKLIDHLRSLHLS